MAQLNDTLVNGDLRVNGNIYGIITSAQSAASAEKLTNTAIKVASATSATSANELINKAIKVNSAGSAGSSYSGRWAKADDNTDVDRVIGVALASPSATWVGGGEWYGSTTYDSVFTYNSKSNTLKVPNINATNISGNLTGVATSATSAKAADGLKSTAYKVASATSATNADKLTNARTIAASGGVTWSVSFNGTTGVTGNAVVNSIPWSAISSYAAAVDTSTTNKFTTPKAVNDAITASMSTKASFKGPYTARSAIPAADLDKLSIFLVGPTGVAPDKFEEWILTGTTTAQMLQIGDTSTDLSNYAQKNGSYTTLSAGYATATNTAQTMKSALSAGYSTSAGAAPFIAHDHSYKLSGNGTAVNVSAGVNFKPSGSNIKFYVSGNDIYISAKNDNSTAYIPSGFQISAINGTTTGVYYLSALKLNAGTNIGFTSASNSQITITAKDTTYGTANFITANKTVGVSSNGTNVGTVNLSAISFSAGSNVGFGTAANNIITITAKDTTYTTLNSINATEYNALTSTSANSRNPNAHQLSSHTNFSTYFNGTSANSALTAKSALSAGSASTAAKATWVAKSDNQEYKMAFSLNSEFNYNTNYTYNPSLQRLTIPSAAKIGGCTLQWNASTSALDFNF